MAGDIAIPVLNGLLGEQSKFEGVITFEGSLRIDGIMTGKLICSNLQPSAVIITENAKVEADIIADLIIVSGSLYGSIYALEKLQLNAPGRLEGRIYTDNLLIENGAYFQGLCISTRDIANTKKDELKKLALQNPGNPLMLSELPENILKPQIISNDQKLKNSSVIENEDSKNVDGTEKIIEVS